MYFFASYACCRNAHREFLVSNVKIITGSRGFDTVHIEDRLRGNNEQALQQVRDEYVSWAVETLNDKMKDIIAGYLSFAAQIFAIFHALF